MELFLTVEQALVVTGVSVFILFLLHRKPVYVEIKEPVVVEKQPERNLRYLQIHTYYGG